MVRRLKKQRLVTQVGRHTTVQPLISSSETGLQHSGSTLHTYNSQLHYNRLHTPAVEQTNNIQCMGDPL